MPEVKLPSVIRVVVVVLFFLFLVWLLQPIWYFTLRYYPFKDNTLYIKVFSIRSFKVARVTYRYTFLKPTSLFCPGCLGEMIYPTNRGLLKMVGKNATQPVSYMGCGKVVNYENSDVNGNIIITMKMDFGGVKSYEFDLRTSILQSPKEFNIEKLMFSYGYLDFDENALMINEPICVVYSDNASSEPLVSDIFKMPDIKFIRDKVKL